MITKKTIVALIILSAIAGSIFLLESQKTARPGVSLGTDGDAEINIENLSSDDVTKMGNGILGISTDDRIVRIKEKASKYERAKEVTTPDGFINIDDINVTELIGKKVVLVDFWTYSCINCQRTLPHLNSWNEKYADKGLIILGIHTPEFEFEKEYENVKRAVEKFEVKYPVILDNDYSTWTAYKNRYWPRKYLIDIDGFIVYDHIGEGAYEETEKKIVELLNERSETLGESTVTMIDQSVNVDTVDFSKVRTPEIYLGYSRNQYLVNLPHNGCINTPCDFTKPNNLKINTYALFGNWEIGEEESYLVSGQGEVIIRFSANKVNLVAGSMREGTRAEILLDGKQIGASVVGSDVSNDGVVIFKEHGLYNLVDLRGEYGEHELIIRILEPGVQVFAFTFG